MVVSHGGDEVELLQADNQWSAKIVNGEYQVQLRGGEDRFEIKDSKLTVSRMGRIAVTVDLRKPVLDSEKPVATTTPPGEQPRTTPGVPQSHLPLLTERWALRFVHVEDRVEVPPLPIDWTQPFTIEAWAERDPNTKNYGGGGIWNVINLSNFCGLAFFRGSMGWQILFSQQLSVGESAKWNTTGSRVHVAAQWTGEEMQLFVNGKCEYSPPSTNLEPGTDAKTWIVQCLTKANGLPIQLGQLQVDTEPESNGSALDGVRISRGVRYTDRFVPAELGEDDKTVALYRFDEGSGDALKDSSGNGHHGKIRTAK